MTQMTDGSPSLSPRGYSTPRDTAAVGQAFFSGVVAAGLGLGTLSVAVLLLWIGSPYPDAGPSGALHIAADLWLLGHGADLVRTGPGGADTPLGLTPLLVGALPCWLLHRAARHALEPPEPVSGGSGLTAPPAVLALSTPPLVPRRAIAWVTAGYLLVGLAALVYAAEGPVRVAPLGALLHLPVVTVAVVALSAWTGTGRPHELLPTAVRRLLSGIPAPGGLRLDASLRAPSWLTRRRRTAALRATGGAVVALMAGGALLTAVSLAGHAGSVHHAFGRLTDVWSGRCGVLLLSLALLPNAVVWGAAYGLGPGFTIGAGSAVGPLSMAGYPDLPDFPLFAALPAPGAAALPYLLLAALVPLATGLSVAWFVSAAAVRAVPRAVAAGPDTEGRAGTGGCAGGSGRGPRGWWARLRGHLCGRGGGKAWSIRETALTAALAAVGCGCATALLTAAAGGPVGSGALADFGPSWWLTGAAALAWCALLGVPGALAMRWCRLMHRTSRRRAGAVSPLRRVLAWPPVRRVRRAVRRLRRLLPTRLAQGRGLARGRRPARSRRPVRGARGVRGGRGARGARRGRSIRRPTPEAEAADAQGELGRLSAADRGTTGARRRTRPGPGPAREDLEYPDRRQGPGLAGEALEHLLPDRRPGPAREDLEHLLPDRRPGPAREDLEHLLPDRYAPPPGTHPAEPRETLPGRPAPRRPAPLRRGAPLPPDAERPAGEM
ncbi:hypothetical protein ACZ90_31595 [Streptomyces albus subsp. albus]|nr:hypothetical protein ACZ90_31595 [Streptomyces albus subsp. albus]